MVEDDAARGGINQLVSMTLCIWLELSKVALRYENTRAECTPWPSVLLARRSIKCGMGFARPRQW